MAAQTLTQVPAGDLEAGDNVDLNEDYIADPDQDLDLDELAMVESVEPGPHDTVFVTFSVNGEELDFEFPNDHKLKVISEE